MIVYKTKSDAVFETLREKFITRQLKPGQRIIISDIAKEFGSSEIPVRGAIRRFESEGFVKVTPHMRKSDNTALNKIVYKANELLRRKNFRSLGR